MASKAGWSSRVSRAQPGSFIDEVLGEHLHQQAVVPCPIGSALVFAHDTHFPEAHASIRSDRLFVIDGGIDGEPMVPTFLDQIASERSDSV